MSASIFRSLARKPLLLASVAIVAGLIVTAIVVVAVTGGNRGPQGPTPTTPDPTATATPNPSSLTASTCRPLSEQLSGTVTNAPNAQWKFQDIQAYPVSPEHGPTATRGGWRFCFSHTPDGSVFAAVNAAVQGSLPSAMRLDWLDYFLSRKSPARGDVLKEAAKDTRGDDQPRGSIRAFRLLAYSGSTAKVEVVTHVSVKGSSILVSGIYALSWEEGDWRLSPPNATNPLRMQTIDSLSGYVIWKE